MVEFNPAAKNRRGELWSERVTDTTLTNGWLSPEGVWYRCAYWEHTGLSYDYLNVGEDALLLLGWCKIQKQDAEEKHLLVLDRDDKRRARLTREQVTTLLVNNVVIPAFMLAEAEGDWSAEIARADARWFNNDEPL
jgi:hypothetical protein